jgi:dTDP-4-dehydrorhamnose reductase
MNGIDDRKRIVVLGSTGMAGHVVTSRLESNRSLEVLNISRTKFNEQTVTIDVTDTKSLEDIISEFSPEIVVNCVGMLIKESEKNKVGAVMVNSLLPHVLSSMCDKHGGRLIHLSTDCVFSGAKGPYDIGDFRDGDSFYDRSKALGEVVNERDLTIRTSITGPELKENGTGLFDWFMQKNGTAPGFTQALWSGVMTTELAKYIETICISRSPRGLIHFSVPGGISKFELLTIFNSVFDRGLTIEPVENQRVDKRLVPTPDNGYEASDYVTQVREMKAWMDDHKAWYSNYRRS